MPEAQVCCGQMHVNTGYLADALPVVRNHVRAFETRRRGGRAERVVRRLGAPPAGDGRRARRRHERSPTTPRSLAGRTYELSELLVDVLGLEDVGAWYPHRVTYHPTCHSLRMLRVGDRPLTLLRHVEDIDLVELPQAESCCGFGGTFALKNHAVSSAMLEDKVRNIESTGASVCTAGDSSCLMHIGGGLSRLQTGTRAVHLAEVLAGTRAEPWEVGVVTRPVFLGHPDRVGGSREPARRPAVPGGGHRRARRHAAATQPRPRDRDDPRQAGPRGRGGRRLAGAARRRCGDQGRRAREPRPLPRPARGAGDRARRDGALGARRGRGELDRDPTW